MLANRTMPPCSVIPELVYDDVEEAIAWLCDAFGFAVRWQAGDHRAQLWAGDGVLVVRDRPAHEGGEGSAAGACASLLIRVADAEAVRSRALAHGGREVRALQDYPYGERQCTFADPAGHRWTFTQSIADVAPEQWGGVSAALERSP